MTHRVKSIHIKFVFSFGSRRKMGVARDFI